MDEYNWVNIAVHFVTLLVRAREEAHEREIKISNLKLKGTLVNYIFKVIKKKKVIERG